MQARAVLHRVIMAACAPMHAARREALEATVWSAMAGRCLTVSALGRSMESEAHEKHCIKRVDRLLSNAHLHEELESLYALMAAWMLGGNRHPVIVVDWSDLDALKRHQLLRASLVVTGRALTLYEEVHEEDTAVKPETHHRFLQRLQGLLPATCQPVLVADAGFRTPWFKAVEALNWYWVSRIRHRHLVRFSAQEPWQPCKALYAKASSVPQSLGQAALTRNQPHHCQLVLYKGEPHGRHRLTERGQRARGIHSEKHARSAREPWLLGTNLPASHFLARKVVRIYQARMQIEEAFRDLKCARFGMSMAYHRTRDADRLSVMLLIAALALMVLWVIGTAAGEHGLARHYQANTERRRVVLSAIFLAARIIKRCQHDFTDAQLGDAWRRIAVENAACWRSE